MWKSQEIIGSAEIITRTHLSSFVSRTCRWNYLHAARVLLLSPNLRTFALIANPCASVCIAATQTSMASRCGDGSVLGVSHAHIFGDYQHTPTWCVVEQPNCARWSRWGPNYCDLATYAHVVWHRWTLSRHLLAVAFLFFDRRKQNSNAENIKFLCRNIRHCRCSSFLVIPRCN